MRIVFLSGAPTVIDGGAMQPLKPPGAIRDGAASNARLVRQCLSRRILRVLQHVESMFYK